MIDASKEFSLSYLSILERILKVTWNADGEPVVVTDFVTRQALEPLKNSLSSFVRSTKAEEAIEYEKRTSRNKVTSVGFGLTGNFSEFVKLGLLCGDRVLLWDILESKTLSSGIATPRTGDLVAEIACNLLLLKPLVEIGAVVVLPHPTVWSDLTRTVLADLGTRNFTTSDVGFLTALSAIHEGIQLHPYTLTSSPEPSQHFLDESEVKEFFSKENQDFQRSATEMFGFDRMQYLRTVTPVQFYESMQDKGEFQRALRDQLTSSLSGLSSQQKKKEINANVSELASLVDLRNRKVLNYASGIAGASVGAVSATIAAFSVETAALQAIALGINSLAQFWSAGHQMLQRPPKSILLQTFSRLEELKGPRTATYIASRDFQSSTSSQEAQNAYAEFMSFYWTEDRHKYLDNLQRDLAVQVLKLINPSDLQIIVNHRRHQQDYIGDYLSYLWGVDEESYWNHMAAIFEDEDGLLVYDGDDHIEVMTSRDMPPYVWDAMLSSLIQVHWHEIERRSMGFPLEFFPGIILFQTCHATDHMDKRQHLVNFLSNLRREDLIKIKWFIDKVYDEEIPDWLVQSVEWN